MGGQTQSKSSPSLDRRQLLTSSAAVTVAGIVPMETTDPPVLNVCAATARRIEEIVARDQIRHEARLPLLSIPKELRRMKTVDDAAEFEEFAARHRQAVWDEVLRPVREAKDDPTWRPTGFMEGLAYQARVSKILRERFIAQRHFCI